MRRETVQARRVCIEWHGWLWLQYGVPLELCEEMVRHVSESLDADEYGVPRNAHDDPWIVRMERYLDQVFSGPCVQHDGWGNLTCFH